MSMQAESLEVLEKANLPSVQARAIVRAIEIELAGARDILATKHDIVLLRADMQQDVTLLRSELAQLGTALRSEMSELATSLRSETSALRTELRAEIRSEIAAATSSITRQMYGAMLGQMAVLLGIAYFFVTQISNG